jgi:Trk K+ transport system NAD-binding subunit
MTVPDEPRSSSRGKELRNIIRYRNESLLSLGTWAVLAWLGAVTALAILLSAFLLTLADVTFAGSEGSSFAEDFWQTLMRVLDPGTMVADVSWGTRLLALLVTLFGILIAGTLIGLIASGVEQRIEQMQRGRGVVIESGHVLILGASARLPVVVNQLTLASRKWRANAIVVMADAEPMELNEDVRSLVRDTRGSRLVFRSGDPSRRADLAIVAVSKARAVIVLAGDTSQGDAGVVKAVLAAGAELGGFDRIPIIAELRDPETAESLSRACGGKVSAVVPLQSFARIAAFALGEPGLSQVVEELLDFGGSDIYLRPLGDLAGSSFGESVYSFTKARPIGRIRSDGNVEINPAPQTPLVEGDRLIVIADDDQAALAATELTGQPAFPTDQRPLLGAHKRHEHCVIIGWNSLGSRLLDQLQHITAAGSSVEVVYDPTLFEPNEIDTERNGNLTVTLTPSSAVTWHLESAARASEFTSIVLLGNRRGLSIQEADGRTLLNLMVLRRELASIDGVAPRIIAELLDADNVELARMSGADDFLVSDAISSRLLVQLAEQPERRDVLLSLYAADGPSIHLVDAETLGLNSELKWDEIISTAYRAGLLAIGWRRSGVAGGGLTLNPDSSDSLHLESDDHLVVIG